MNKTYIIPELRITTFQTGELLQLQTSEAEGGSGENLGKKRNDDAFADDNWGKVDNSLW